MPSVHVISPGFLTTIQDLGRYGFAHLGVSASGVADALSLRIGNLLVGNPQDAAGLEMTLTGGVFEFESPAVIALTGSDFQPTLDSQTIPLWTSIRVISGQVLRCGATKSGARCYLSLHGGINVPLVLGSTSTHLLTGMGGFNGRALQEGDVLTINTSSTFDSFRLLQVNPKFMSQLMRRNILRVTRGPQINFFPDEALILFCTSYYIVTEESNRMGLRLNGSALRKTQTSELLTEGVSLGAVQVPDDGKPIILFVEHQTTGGYPKIANVISADFHTLGQLRPRDEVLFEMVSIEQATSLLRDQEALINPTSLMPV